MLWKVVDDYGSYNNVDFVLPFASEEIFYATFYICKCKDFVH